MTDDVNLWSFFEKREEEIVRLRADLKRELLDLRAARSSLERRNRRGDSHEQTEKLTIKEKIRAVLERHPNGGSSDQIVSWIGEAFDTEVARPSLTPQLSRLKHEGRVELDDEQGIWRLVGIQRDLAADRFGSSSRRGREPRVTLAEEEFSGTVFNKNFHRRRT